MTKLPLACPFCDTPYVTTPPGVPIGLSLDFRPDGEIIVLCPRCREPFPGSFMDFPGVKAVMADERRK